MPAPPVLFALPRWLAWLLLSALLFTQQAGLRHQISHLGGGGKPGSADVWRPASAEAARATPLPAPAEVAGEARNTDSGETPAGESAATASLCTLCLALAGLGGLPSALTLWQADEARLSPQHPAPVLLRPADRPLARSRAPPYA